MTTNVPFPLSVRQSGFHFKILFVLAALTFGSPALGQAYGQDADTYKSASDQDMSDDDPWESWNRGVFEFNDFIDTWFLRPVAKGYRTITPHVVDESITNFFNNLSEAKNLVNSMLQLKGESAVVAAGRFTFNTTFGLAGLFDVADSFGLPERPEDFGQTLGYWGTDSGPYLMLPFLGPSSVRDFGGLTVDVTLTPSTWDYIDSPEKYYMRGLQVVDQRADLIPAESFISGDRYNFVRNAYLQRREFLINDGKVTSDPFASDDDGVLLDDF